MSYVSAPKLIDQIYLFPITDDEIKNGSYVMVENTNQIENNKKPYERGIYDSRMGAQFNVNCTSCKNQTRSCPGHTGYIDLDYPIITSIYEKYIIKWIKIICTRCHKILFDIDIKHLYSDFEEVINETEDKHGNILNYFSKKLKARKKIFCDHCNDVEKQINEGITQLSKMEIKYIQPQYVLSEDNKLIIEEYLEPPKGTAKKYSKGPGFSVRNKLLPHDQLAILEMLHNNELIKIGLDIRVHPRHFIKRKLIIPPINMRFINNVKYKTDGNNYITSNLEKVFTANKVMKDKVINKFIDGFFDNVRNMDQINMRTINKLYEEYEKYIGYNTSADTNNTSIHSNFKGKNGLVRNKANGKIVSTNVFRVVVGCNPHIKIPEVLMPEACGTTMHIKDYVTPYNLEILNAMVKNKDGYPRCDRIYSRRLNRIIKNEGNNYEIVPGDHVYRSLITGDTSILNRSPTLFTTSICSHKVIINEGHRPIHNASINVTACKAYNADFDGDQMFMKIVTSPEARLESEMLLAFDRYILGFGNGAPNIGLVQDSVIGCAMLTDSKTKLSKYEAMRLFNNIPIEFPMDKDFYTGRELFSIVMPSIHYEANSSMFKEPFIKEFGDFDESDYKIVIKKGNLLSGIVCGDAIKDKPGSIYHIIANNISKKVAMITTHYHQQICGKFLELHGSTLTFGDIRLNQDSEKLLFLIKSRMAREMDEFYSKIMHRNFTLPTDKTISQYVEENIMRIMATDKKLIYAILKSIDPSNNWLFKMVSSGAKGSYNNIINSLASVGLLKIDAKLIENNLGDYRYSIHSRQFSDDPIDRGYVPNSLVNGIDPRYTLTIGMETRRNILTKGLTVSVAGYKGKVAIKSTESAVVSHRLFTCRGYGKNIIELHNVDDGFKPSNAQTNIIESIFMSDKEIIENYGKERSKIIISDRDDALDKFGKLQNNNPMYVISNKVKLPIDIDQIIKNTDPEGKEKPEKNFKELDLFLDNLYYLRFNGIHKEKETKIPDFLKVNFYMLKIAIRSAFNINIISRYPAEKFKLLLNLIAYKIVDAFFEAGDSIGVIMGQAFSAPLTQYLIDAHHASVSGGTSEEGLNYCTGIFHHKKVTDSTINFMYVYLKEKYENEYKNAELLAKYITSERLVSFLKHSEILYETPGEFETYPDEKKLFNDYIKKNNIEFSGNKLYPIHFRLVLNEYAMKLKNITADDIFNKIEKVYEDNIISINLSTDKSNVILLYFKLGFSWNYIDRLEEKRKDNKLTSNIWNYIIKFYNQFINRMTINSFRGINGVSIKSFERIKAEKGEIKKQKKYYLLTNGINIEDILTVNVVDKSRTCCNNVMETYKYEGLIPTKMTIMRELDNTLKGPLGFLPTTYSLFSNLMIELGYPTAISDVGQKLREPNDILARMALNNPMVPIITSSINGTGMECKSHTADIILGQRPRYVGTGRDKIILNKEFMKEHYKEETEEDFI